MGHNSPWKELIFLKKQHGSKLRDPTTDAEHSIIFNSVFGSCPKKSTLDLRPDVVDFVTCHLRSYEKSEKESFRCSFDSHCYH